MDPILDKATYDINGLFIFGTINTIASLAVIP